MIDQQSDHTYDLAYSIGSLVVFAMFFFEVYVVAVVGYACGSDLIVDVEPVLFYTIVSYLT